MRKFLVIVFGVVSVSMSAQARDIDVGTVQMLGSRDASFRDTTVEGTDGSKSDVWQLEFDLSAVYYFVPNFGLGGYVKYGKTGLEDFEVESYSVGPRALYNYSLSETTSLYAKGAVGLLQVDAPTATRDGWEYMLGGGFRYFLGKHVSVDTGLIYNEQNWDTDGVNTTDKQIAVEIGFSIYLGNE